MNYRSKIAAAAYDSQVADWQPRHDEWAASDPDTRGPEPVAPEVPPVYSAELHQGSAITLNTPYGPTAVMDGTYIFTNVNDPTDQFAVHEQDLAGWEQVV